MRSAGNKTLRTEGWFEECALPEGSRCSELQADEEDESGVDRFFNYFKRSEFFVANAPGFTF